jgi:hypothetical protein
MQLAEEGTLGVLGTCLLFDKVSRADTIFIRQMLTIRPLRIVSLGVFLCLECTHSLSHSSLTTWI